MTSEVMGPIRKPTSIPSSRQYSIQGCFPQLCLNILIPIDTCSSYPHQGLFFLWETKTITESHVGQPVYFQKKRRQQKYNQYSGKLIRNCREYLRLLQIIYIYMYICTCVLVSMPFNIFLLFYFYFIFIYFIIERTHIAKFSTIQWVSV